jgi:hypothetical protein
VRGHLSGTALDVLHRQIWLDGAAEQDGQSPAEPSELALSGVCGSPAAGEAGRPRRRDDEVGLGRNFTEGEHHEPVPRHQ